MVKIWTVRIDSWGMGQLAVEGESFPGIDSFAEFSAMMFAENLGVDSVEVDDDLDGKTYDQCGPIVTIRYQDGNEENYCLQFSSDSEVAADAAANAGMGE